MQGRLVAVFTEISVPSLGSFGRNRWLSKVFMSDLIKGVKDTKFGKDRYLHFGLLLSYDHLLG